MSSVVSVWTHWGDYAVGVRDVRRGETLRVGSPPRRLVRCDGVRATVWLHEGAQTLKAGESVAVERDGVHYRVSCTDVGREGLAAPRPWRELLTLAAGLGLATLGLFPGREHPETSREPSTDTGQRPLPRLQGEPARSPQNELAVASEPQKSALRTPGRLRCGTQEMGRRVADLGGRYGVAGPKDNPDPHLARPEEGAGQSSTPDGPALETLDVVGIPHVLVGNDAPTAPWGRSDQLGTDEQSARGQMWRELLGEAWGDSGLGRAAQPGGISKRIEVAPTSDAGKSALRVLHTGLQVVGPRKASEVGRAMSALFEDFKGCAAQARLGERRRVELDFEVEQNGQVTRGAHDRDALAACLDAHVASARFTPGASAVARVRYPLYFVPVSDEVRSMQVTPSLPPAPCDCGG